MKDLEGIKLVKIMSGFFLKEVKGSAWTGYEGKEYKHSSTPLPLQNWEETEGM